ncbi:RALY RNA binding protein like [Phyllostomus discolor]|uniref:RALY RNA binding protein like n=1 Tax=Phyllostomus discolor TaxID=89673 RepID=A0A833ZQP2_9CHIR|nr:RALY RNA binding protein like [Phyllostomus discolor]
MVRQPPGYIVVLSVEKDSKREQRHLFSFLPALLLLQPVRQLPACQTQSSSRYLATWNKVAWSNWARGLQPKLSALAMVAPAPRKLYAKCSDEGAN